MELHHIVPKSEGGEETVENCVPLCFDCHADVGHYNPKHPKGTKFSASELRGHRESWYEMMSRLAVEEQKVSAPEEYYEGQVIELTGFVWRESFPGPPNYESLKTDRREVYWMLILAHTTTLVASSPEDGSSYAVTGIKRVQLSLSSDQYNQNRHLLLKNAHVRGRLYPSMTGHHHGDALFEVATIWGEASGGDAEIYYPVSPTARHAPIPKIHGLDYDAARASLINAGWQPRMHGGWHAADVCGTALHYWNKGYWEVIESSGTGLNHCSFGFMDVYDNRLIVVTVGEVGSDSGGTAVVWNWHFDQVENEN